MVHRVVVVRVLAGATPERARQNVQVARVQVALLLAPVADASRRPLGQRLRHGGARRGRRPALSPARATRAARPTAGRRRTASCAARCGQTRDAKVAFAYRSEKPHRGSVISFTLAKTNGHNIRRETVRVVYRLVAGFRALDNATTHCDVIHTHSASSSSSCHTCSSILATVTTTRSPSIVHVLSSGRVARKVFVTETKGFA